MRALRLHGANGIEDLAIDEVELRPPAEGEALVRVHAAALTRDELDWPVDRLPAVPSYELSGAGVLVHGATGGVGHLATQLAHWRGAYVIGTVSGAGTETARELGADEVVDRTSTRFEDAVDDVDLVFDTVGGDVLVRSAEWLG